MTGEAHPATTGPVDLDRLRRQVMSNEEAERAAAELHAARLDLDDLDGRLQLANEVIDAFREYPSGTMPMVDVRLRDYDATAEGGS